MNFVIDIALTLIVILNIVFHSVGIYLLLSLPTRDLQETYLMNLSTSEITGNILELFVNRVPKILTYHGITLKFISRIREFTSIIFATVISTTYYFAMIFITLDKFFDIFLSIRYPTYWNKTRAKRLIMCVWGLSVLVCIGLSVAYAFRRFSYKNEIRTFFMTPLDVLCIILATVTYTFIFKKFQEKRTKPVVPTFLTSNNAILERRPSPPSCWQIFRRSRFLVSVLLILSFLLFMIVPDMINLFYGLVYRDDSEALRDTTMIVYQVSYLFDALIYLFMHQPIRRLIKKKLHLRRIRASSGQSDSKLFTRRVSTVSRLPSPCIRKTVTTTTMM